VCEEYAIMHKTKMHNCWFCKNPLKPWAEWKGDDEHFYCNEFCADAGAMEMPTVPGPAEMASFRMPGA
jgi:hypothetical protein